VNDSAEPYIIQAIAGFNEARVAAEAELSTRPVDRPLPQRAEWQRAHGAVETLLVIARTPGGDPVRSVSASIASSRALPGHRIYRVERFGGSASPQADEAALSAIADAAHGDQRCLRLVVEVFERDASVRARLSEALRRLGFARAPNARMYERTRGIDLRQPSSKVLASVHKTARSNIRSLAKRGFEVRPIVETSLAPRLAELSRPAHRRTATFESSRPWARIIALSASNPRVSRVAGLFDPHGGGPDALLAFAWGCVHGSYVSYEEGAAERHSEVARASLGCPPLWDLIVWANEQASVAWFDLGGVAPDHTRDGPSGDSEVKRYFGRDVIEVGEEWSLEPSKVRAAIARGVSDVVHWIDDVWRSNADYINRSIARWANADSAGSRPAWSMYRIHGHTLLLPGDPARDPSLERRR
jgi:hypothetical protein